MRLRHATALGAVLFSAVMPISAVIGGSEAAAAGTTTVVVKPSNYNAAGWFSPFDAATGTAVLAEGPAPTPLGIGSLGITLSSSADHLQVYNYGYSICVTGPLCTAPGTPLSSIDAMAYSTYKNTVSPAGIIPNYAIEIDPDSTMSTGVDCATIQWTPSHNGGGVLDGTWQTWDVLGGGSGVFYSTRDLTGYGVFECAPWACTATWSEIVAALPNGIIKYGIGLNSGSGWSSLAASVDAFAIGVAGSTTIFDFEPECVGMCPTVGLNTDEAIVEGNLGTHIVSIPVTLSPAYPDGDITVSWQTANGTATNGTLARDDYLAASGTVTILAGDTTALINVRVKGDTKLERYESFFVVLTGANAALGDTSATVTIQNDEVPKVKLVGKTVEEGAPAKFRAKLRQQYYAPLSLTFLTNDSGTAKPADGDFVAVPHLVLTVPAGAQNAVVWVTTLKGGVSEPVIETIKANVWGGRAVAHGKSKIRPNVT